MRKSVIALTASVAVGLGSLFGGFNLHTEASKLSNLKNQKREIQEERSDLSADIQASDREIKRLQAEQEKVADQIERLTSSIETTDKKIKEKEQNIVDTQNEIKKLEEEIKVLQERIAKRNELLKERVRNYQVSGGMVSYIDVLMGATSFSDFIDRASAVATIMEADKGILEQHQADKKAVEEKQAKVKQDLENLKKMLADLEVLKKNLASQRAQQAALMKKLEQQEQAEHDHKMSLEEENQVLRQQEIAMAQAIKLEQARIAEEAERARKEAEARAAAEAAARAAAAKSGKAYTPPAPVSTPKVTSGNFMKPTNAPNTSGFGPRWGRMHYGVDWAKRGTVPIVAAASGVVSSSYKSSSYGNVVFITHSINGQTWTTVYAHMARPGVPQGTVVTKGQLIGYMGSTGDSTGQHLHFELHKGGWNGSKSNAVNPFAYGVPR